MLQLLFRNVSVIFPVNISNTQTINGGKFVCTPPLRGLGQLLFTWFCRQSCPRRLWAKCVFCFPIYWCNFRISLTGGIKMNISFLYYSVIRKGLSTCSSILNAGWNSQAECERLSAIKHVVALFFCRHPRLPRPKTVSAGIERENISRLGYSKR